MNEILLQSYYEHLKAESEMARYLPPDHLRRAAVRRAIEEMGIPATKEL